MTFNLGSLCMAILWNSIFIAIVFWIGKKKIYTTRKGIHLTLMFYLLGLVRMIFPIDFRPSIGIQVSKGTFPIINNVIGLEKHNLWGRQFTIANALAAIWLIVAVFLMLRYFVKYQEMRRIFQKYSTEANEQCQSVLSRIKQEKKIKKKIAVYQNPGITIPCAEGVFRWNIYFPDYDYSEEELYYALLHECTHFTNGDLYIKWLTQLCRRLCWWNPLVYKMQDTLEKNLEIRCDLTVTEKLSQKEQLSYLGTIVKTLKNAQKKRGSGVLYGVHLADKNGEELKERFEIICKNQDKKTGRNQQKKYIGLFLVVIIFSYMFMITPAYDTPKDQIITGEGIEEMLPENTYILKEGEKYYTVHKSEIRERIEKEELPSDEVEEMQRNGFEVKENEER